MPKNGKLKKKSTSESISSSNSNNNTVILSELAPTTVESASQTSEPVFRGDRVIDSVSSCSVTKDLLRDIIE